MNANAVRKSKRSSRVEDTGRAAWALGPVLHATLLVAAQDGRVVKLEPSDCREVLSQASKVSSLVSTLREVEALVRNSADALGTRSSSNLALRVRTLTRAALRGA